MPFIEKELLLSRVKYLIKIQDKPGSLPINPAIIEKVNQMIESEEILSFMQVEAVFNYLVEKSNGKQNDLNERASEILEFIN